MNKPELAVGTCGTATSIVEDADLADKVGLSTSDTFPAVYATSRMIALMELAAARAMIPALGEGENSVGVTVDIEHTPARRHRVRASPPRRAISAATANCICSTFSRATTPALSGKGATSARWSTPIGWKSARHSGAARDERLRFLCRTGLRRGARVRFAHHCATRSPRPDVTFPDSIFSPMVATA